MSAPLQVEECPKCGCRTFAIVLRGSFGGHREGKCYKCGHTQKIELP